MLFLNTSWFKTISLCPSIYATIRSNITLSINLHITHVRLISLQEEEEEEEEACFPRFSQELYICIFHFVGFHLFPDDVHLTYQSFYEIFKNSANCWSGSGGVTVRMRYSAASIFSLLISLSGPSQTLFCCFFFFVLVIYVGLLFINFLKEVFIKLVGTQMTASNKIFCRIFTLP